MNINIGAYIDTSNVSNRSTILKVVDVTKKYIYVKDVSYSNMLGVVRILMRQNVEALLEEKLIELVNNNKVKLFVYGTLKKGFGNSGFLRNAKFIGEDTVKGELYAYISKDYKGVPFLFRGEDDIKGEVYELTEIQLSPIDEMEINAGYAREEVVTDKGITAYAYFSNDPAQKEYLHRIMEY